MSLPSLGTSFLVAHKQVSLWGKAKWVEKMKKHPLMRILRIDKLTLAALEATLRAYLDPDTVKTQIPTLQNVVFQPRKTKKTG